MLRSKFGRAHMFALDFARHAGRRHWTAREGVVKGRALATDTASMRGTMSWSAAVPSMASTVMLMVMRVTPPSMAAAPTTWAHPTGNPSAVLFLLSDGGSECDLSVWAT